MSIPAHIVRSIPIIPHYVAGRPVAPEAGRLGPVYNPAIGELAGQVALASAAETQSAIAAAQVAFPRWSNTPPLQRARVLFRFKALLEAHEAELAAIITREHGKVFSDARGEVTSGMEAVMCVCCIPHL